MELSVENLSCARGGIAILEGVNFTLKPGTALILRGPNGSGKTTLLRTIAGLQPALSGHVHLDADAIAYSGHADGLKATLSVADNLNFWAGIYGTATIDAALQAFDLTALAARPAQNLSAGQKRRLGLARLLVTGRPIWIMDEPTVSLDADSVAMFASAIQGHLARGGSAIMATHIDLKVQADTLDVAQFRARTDTIKNDFDEAFL
jgi:heme exporter protein A